MKKTALAMIILLMITLCLPVAAAENETYDGVYNRIYALQEKFPHGMCWNHIVETDDDIGLTQKKEQSREYRERFAESVTTHACAAHSSWETVGSGDYECNFFDGGSQCYGFARKIFYDVFGVRVSRSQYRYDYKNVQVGDYVRFGDNQRGHSFIVLSKDGNKVKALECNWGERCKIYWGVHTYDLSGTITSTGGSTFSFNHYVHAENYDEINKKYATPSETVLPSGNVGTYGVILDEAAYTTENPFYEKIKKDPSDHDGSLWYVWGRTREKLGVSLDLTDDVKTWADETEEFETGNVPYKNSIAVWSDGYAAFVEDHLENILYISGSSLGSKNGSVYYDGYFDGDGAYTNTFACESSGTPDLENRGLPEFYVYLEEIEDESLNEFLDLDENGTLDADDAVYLLRNMMRPERYPVSQSGDMNGDGKTNFADAVYLFRHIASPDEYPIEAESD